MSVYKRPGASTYTYDFEVGGIRFSGDTGEVDKRKARKDHDERRRVERAKYEGAKGKVGRLMTLEVGAARYMEEVGQHHVNALTTLGCLEWLVSILGKNTRLADIGEEKVAFAVARRRQEFRKVGNERTPKKLVSPATVNRTCTEPLRKVMLRAEAKWQVPVQKIDWASHMLPEREEIVREASVNEEAIFMDELERGYDDAVEFAFLSGCRRMEIVPRGLNEADERYKGLTWARVDFFGRRVTVVGKGGKTRVLPMTNRIFLLLWEQIGNDPVYVFTYAAKRTDKRKGIVRGVRYPMLSSGLRTMARRALVNGKVPDFRFHDIRHTAATRALRESNLRVVQNMLGHSDPATTAKYAHALLSDLNLAMEAAAPTKLPTDEVEFRLKLLSGNGKSG